jgi:hypothetical protein
MNSSGYGFPFFGERETTLFSNKYINKKNLYNIQRYSISMSDDGSSVKIDSRTSECLDAALLIYQKETFHENLLVINAGSHIQIGS